MFKKSFLSLAVLFAATQITACGGSSDSNNDTSTELTTAQIIEQATQYIGEETTYGSTLSALSNENSVSYSGQTARQLLINELTNYINSGLQADIDGSEFADSDEVYDKLLSYYQISTNDYENIVSTRTLTTTASKVSLDTVQASVGEVSSSHKDLYGKIAGEAEGQDEVGQHKIWADEFVAFGDKGTRTPDEEIKRLFGLLADIVYNVQQGAAHEDADENALPVYVDATTGLDYKQLIQKILLGAVAFSQGADDYLDDDTENKGLNTDHTALVVKSGSEKTYTNLEHQFDEGFGYFGAARDYLDYDDGEIRANGNGRSDYQGMHDTDGDGEIDFMSEFNFAASVNAAKRDLGSVDFGGTDYTEQAMVAFVAARKLLAETAGEALDTEQTAQLKQYRDVALDAWEKAISATAVHYVNDTISDTEAYGTESYSYANLAKHWSELKGFVVSLQFNRRSPLSDEQHQQVNTLIKDAPVVPTGSNQTEVDDYIADLITARNILRDAYEFDADTAANW